MVMHLVRVAYIKKMPNWVRSVLGVLGLSLPLSVLFWWWSSWRELIALWSVNVIGGGLVLIAFSFESWQAERTARLHTEQINQVLTDQLRGSDGKER